MGLIQDYVGWEDAPDLDVKVNTIIDFWSNPCNAPWSVYVETLYPALGRMFLALVDTSLLDIARGYLRPRGGLTRGANRKKGRRRGLIRGIPDTADLFARMIPGSTIYAGMEYGANTKFLWQIDGIIQRGLWYVVLFDATTDGLYYWAQGIKEEQFCKPTRRPGLFATDDHVALTAAFGLWWPSAGWNVQWEEAGFSLSIGRLQVPPGKWIFTFHADFHNDADYLAKIEYRVKGAGPAAYTSVIAQPREHGTIHLTCPLEGGANWALEQRVTGHPWVEGGPGVVQVQAA